jgi:UDPglucose--hexose-1-phosphate uridylyltransferase
MEERDIEKVISLWQKEYTTLGSDPNINHVQIFENKGAIMGCSNPHPHGQIWAQRSIPQEVEKKVVRQKSYWDQNNSSLLGDYLKQELNAKERIVLENESFVALVPYWAVWPFEAMIVPKRHITSILELTEKEVSDYASILKALTTRYDNLFDITAEQAAQRLRDCATTHYSKNKT